MGVAGGMNRVSNSTLKKTVSVSIAFGNTGNESSGDAAVGGESHAGDARTTRSIQGGRKRFQLTLLF